MVNYQLFITFAKMNYQALWRRLAQVYDEGEAKAIARMVYEARYGLSWSDVMMGKDADVPQDELEEIAQRLERHEPIQYILGKAEFMGEWFDVEPGVLIPRPETEELVRWIVLKETTANILDIGTGSGCIAITLAAKCPKAKVTAWDISKKALEVARKNAKRLGVNITFEQVDILNFQFSTFNFNFSAQPPLKSLAKKMMPRKVSSIAMAVHTPFNPYFGASVAANVKRTAHIELRLMIAGIIVSPAPMNTPLATMATANIGSAQASMRSTSVPMLITSSTGDMILISSGANIHINTPITVITAIPRPTDR